MTLTTKMIWFECRFECFKSNRTEVGVRVLKFFKKKQQGQRTNTLVMSEDGIAHASIIRNAG